MSLSAFNREDATFQYPSVATTAAYCIDFWSNVEIPTEVYEQFTSAYDNELSAQTSASAEQIYFAWLDGFGEDTPDAETTHAMWVVICDEETPKFEALAMPHHDVPIIARAALLHHNAPTEEYGAERDAVLDYQVLLTSGTFTVSEVADRYCPETIYWSVSTVPQKPEKVNPAILLDAINNVTRELESLTDATRRLEPPSSDDSMKRLADQQESLLQAMQASAKQQQPVAKLAQASLDQIRINEENEHWLRNKQREEYLQDRIDERMSKGAFRWLTLPEDRNPKYWTKEDGWKKR